MNEVMNNVNYRRLVIFLPQSAKTGGERYLMEVTDYLKRQGVKVLLIRQDRSIKGRKGLNLIYDCLLANFRFFKKAMKMGTLSEVVFFEDFQFHPRLWLFNVMVYTTVLPLRVCVGEAVLQRTTPGSTRTVATTSPGASGTKSPRLLDPRRSLS